VRKRLAAIRQAAIADFSDDEDFEGDKNTHVSPTLLFFRKFFLPFHNPQILRNVRRDN
jgi:hypothetical protein